MKMVEPIRYVNVNSSHIFDFNYQKASLLLLLETLKKNDNTSAKIKKNLIDKARDTLGLNRLPDSDRVTPFFHCLDGEFHITFLYDSAIRQTQTTPAKPWEMIIANNFGELIPLFLEIYDLLKRPIFNSSQATIGNFSVFHHQNAIAYHPASQQQQQNNHRYLGYNNHNETGEETGEDLSVTELNGGSRLVEKTIEKRTRKPQQQVINNRVLAIKKSTTTTKKGKKNSLVHETIQMSSSMPNLNNTMNSTGMFTHRYATRNSYRKNNNSILAN